MNQNEPPPAAPAIDGQCHEKSIGQVIYESVREGGIQNWGEWQHAPEIVRDIHDRLARAAIAEYRRRKIRLDVVLEIARSAE